LLSVTWPPLELVEQVGEGGWRIDAMEAAQAQRESGQPKLRHAAGLPLHVVDAG